MNQDGLSQNLAFINRLLDFDDTTAPRHFGDDLLYYCRPGTTLPQIATWMTKIFTAGADAHPNGMMMIPEAITNGVEYYNVARINENRIREANREYGGILSTYRLSDAPVDKRTLNDRKRVNQDRATMLHKQIRRHFPQFATILPTGMESAVRQLASAPEISNRQIPYDEDFELFWIGVCNLSHAGCFGGDYTYSRNGNFEVISLLLNYYGATPDWFPQSGKTDLFFADGSVASPLDIAEHMFDHILDVTRFGFTTELSVTNLTRILALEDMLHDRYEHPQFPGLGQQMRDRGHDQLVTRMKDDGYSKRFDRLRYRFLKLMDQRGLQPCGHEPAYTVWAGDDLDHYIDWVKNSRQPMLGPAFQIEADEMPDTLRSANDPCDDRLKIVEPDRQFRIGMSHDQPSYEMGRPFNKYYRPRLFDEEARFFFDRVEPVWQAGLRLSRGVMDTAYPARDTQSHIIYVGSRRAGGFSISRARELGFINPKNARGSLSQRHRRQFDQENVPKNIDHDLQMVGKLHQMAGEEGKQITVYHSEQINEMMGCSVPGLFAGYGPDRQNSLQKYELLKDMIRCRADQVIFHDGWAHSPGSLSVRLYARLIQLGIVDRPLNNRYHLEIYDESPGEIKSASLMDDASMILSALEEGEASNDQNLGPQVAYLAKTDALLRMYYSPQIRDRLNKRQRPNFSRIPQHAIFGVEATRDHYPQELQGRIQEALIRNIDQLDEVHIQSDLRIINKDLHRQWQRHHHEYGIYAGPYNTPDEHRIEKGINRLGNGPG